MTIQPLTSVDEIAVWWTSQAHCEAVGEPHYYKGNEDYWATRTEDQKKGVYWLDDSPLPDYLKRQFLSRYGRAGRGRLWVPEGIEVRDMEWPDPETPIAQKASNCGGIVFWRNDLDIVRQFPGFVTDWELNLLSATPPFGSDPIAS